MICVIHSQKSSLLFPFQVRHLRKLHILFPGMSQAGIIDSVERMSTEQARCSIQSANTNQRLITISDMNCNPWWSGRSCVRIWHISHRKAYVCQEKGHSTLWNHTLSNDIKTWKEIVMHLIWFDAVYLFSRTSHMENKSICIANI